MEGGIDKYVDTILDNQARINNLEDTEINKIIMFLDKISIRNNFENSKLVEISHHRKSITSVKVMEQMLKTDTETLFKDITHSVSISERNSIIGGIETKKVIIESNDPITGYAIIL